MPNDARVEELAHEVAARIKCASTTSEWLIVIEEALRTAIREAREGQARDWYEAVSGLRGLDRLIAARLTREANWNELDRQHHRRDLKLRDEVRALIDQMVEAHEESQLPTTPE